jgi:hypothetical protein
MMAPLTSLREKTCVESSLPANSVVYQVIYGFSGILRAKPLCPPNASCPRIRPAARKIPLTDEQLISRLRWAPSSPLSGSRPYRLSSVEGNRGLGIGSALGRLVRIRLRCIRGWSRGRRRIVERSGPDKVDQDRALDGNGEGHRRYDPRLRPFGLPSPSPLPLVMDPHPEPGDSHEGHHHPDPISRLVAHERSGLRSDVAVSSPILPVSEVRVSKPAEIPRHDGPLSRLRQGGRAVGGLGGLPLNRPAEVPRVSMGQDGKRYGVRRPKEKDSPRELRDSILRGRT